MFITKSYINVTDTCVSKWTSERTNDKNTAEQPILTYFFFLLPAVHTTPPPCAVIYPMLRTYIYSRHNTQPSTTRTCVLYVLSSISHVLLLPPINVSPWMLCTSCLAANHINQYQPNQPVACASKNAMVSLVTFIANPPKGPWVDAGKAKAARRGAHRHEEKQIWTRTA